jgi:hypothetical protein
MSDILVIREPIQEGVNPLFQARVVNQLGVVLTPADVEVGGVTLRVYVDDDATPVLTMSSLDPNTTYALSLPLMQTPLQTTGWSKDNIGRNFAHLPDISQATTPGDHGGYTLHFEYEFQLVAAQGDGVCYALFECPVLPVRSN